MRPTRSPSWIRNRGSKHSADPERYVIPDLIVEKIDGEYMVFANDTSLPRLRLSRAYREVAREKGKFTGENKDFISSKLNSANWMIQAIEQRRQTMLKVMGFIVDRQRAFFEKGVQHLRPLTLREVAEHIEMHESTVSRVTNDKFVQTPRGVFSLKFFFSSGLSTTSGEDISARGVKAKIQTLVDDEDHEATPYRPGHREPPQGRGSEHRSKDRGQVPGSVGNSPGPHAKTGVETCPVWRCIRDLE